LDVENARADVTKTVEKEREDARSKQDNFRAETQKELKGMSSGNARMSPVTQRMVDLSKTTLPQVDKIMDETTKVAAQLGPATGRWNEFMTGKVGAPNPEFAHYKDEVDFLDSAITLAHSQGRVSNAIYQTFKQMFDTGKQSPENMIEALKVAKEWLTNYANMGQPGGASATPSSTPVPAASNRRVIDLTK
jgi:hypothetical protein